ncbi:MAG: polysialyltransferase family glycosyltransferase [Campylobacterota bacterium]|nr:polysialyltransferase family glycosyltransferase [Campylobacterota bacterium]
MINKVTLPNLFIVKTPLQIINSIEAVNYFNLTNNVLILISSSDNQNYKQMTNLINLYNWHQVIKIEGKASFFKYLSLIKELKKEKYNFIFFARFGSMQRLILSNVNKEKVYYFDDGTETITMYNEMLLPNKINQFNLRHLFRFRFLLFGLKVNITDTINLFTYFDLKPFEKSEVVLNKLEYFREKYLKPSAESQLVYLLGQPLYEKNLVSEKTYLDCIKKIKSTSNKKIIYIPHKGESDSSKVLSLIDDTFDVKHIDIPIELYFLGNKIKPSHIVSFFTTAFFTLKLFYPNTKFESIYIPKEEILNKADIIESHYDFIFSIGINKLEKLNNEL